MRALHLGGAGEVGEAARHLQHAVIGAGRQVEAVGRLEQQGAAVAVGVDEALDQGRRGGGVGEDLGVAGGAVALALAGARRGDADGDRGRGFARRRAEQVGGADGGTSTRDRCGRGRGRRRALIVGGAAASPAGVAGRRPARTCTGSSPRRAGSAPEGDAGIGARHHHLPLSSGWRRLSSTDGAIRHSSRNSTPLWARLASPGRMRMPPPTSAAIEAE